MQVHAGAGAVAVSRLEERAFGDHDLRLGEFVAHEEFAGRGVAGVRDERNLELPRDLDALRAQLAQPFLREIAVFLPQLAAPLDDREAEARHGVLGRDRAEEGVVAQLEVGVGSETDDLERRALPLERLPRAHHRAQMRLDLRMAHASTDRHARLAVGRVGHVRLAADLLEVALAEPVWKPADMVHVRVRERDRGHAEDRARALPDVEADVELRHLDHRLLAGDADSLDPVRRQIEKAELALAGRCAWKHW